MVGRCRLISRIFCGLVVLVGISFSAAPAAEAETWRVTNADPTWRLNIRQNATSRSRIVGIIPGNTRGIQGLQCVGNWCEVIYSGVRGWVYDRYIEPDDSAPAGSAGLTPLAPESLARQETIRLLASGGGRIPLHAFPNDKLPKVGELPAGTQQVEGFGTCVTGWCHIRAGELIGWLQIKHISPDQPEAPSDAAGPATTATIRTGAPSPADDGAAPATNPNQQ